MLIQETTPKIRAEKILEKIIMTLNVPILVRPMLNQYWQEFNKKATSDDIVRMCREIRSLIDYIEDVN